MTTLQDKLDNIYQTKLEIKSAIGTDSDVFSEYPAMIRSMAGGGVSYSYLDERLSYYVETEDLNTTLSYYVETTDLEAMGYATESYVTNAISNIPGVDLSSYVTYTYLESKEYLTEIPNTYATYAAISEMGYITYSYGDSIYVSYAYIGDLNEITEYILGSSSGEAPENVYATKYELGSYVSKDELNNASYATESYVTNAISNIPSVDTSSYVTYTYLESKEYLTEIPDTYATYAAISEMGYLTNVPSDYPTYTAIEAMGYATTYEVNNYLNTSNLSKTSSSAYHTLWSRGLGITSNNQIYPAYLTTDNVEGSWYSEGWVSCSTLKKYVNDKLSNNIIPKENNTYTLGDADHIYNATYTSDVWLGADTRLSFRTNNQVNLYMNGNWRYVFHTNNFSPVLSTVNLGSSTNKWAATYTTTLYADNAYTYNNYLGSSKIYHYADNNIYIDYANGKRLIINPNTIYGSSGLNLGTNNLPINNIYMNSTYIHSATYLPTNTYWWNGTSYVWLGSLFT